MQDAAFALALILALARRCRCRRLARARRGAHRAGTPLPPRTPALPAGPGRPQLLPLACDRAHTHALAHAPATAVAAARKRPLLERAANAAAHTRARLGEERCGSPRSGAARGLRTRPWSHGSPP